MRIETNSRQPIEKLNSEKYPRINNAKNYLTDGELDLFLTGIKRMMTSKDSFHGIDHIERVLEAAENIVLTESLDSEVDRAIIYLAIAWHDVGLIEEVPNNPFKIVLRNAFHGLKSVRHFRKESSKVLDAQRAKHIERIISRHANALRMFALKAYDKAFVPILEQHVVIDADLLDAWSEPRFKEMVEGYADPQTVKLSHLIAGHFFYKYICDRQNISSFNFIFSRHLFEEKKEILRILLNEHIDLMKKYWLENPEARSVFSKWAESNQNYQV